MKKYIALALIMIMSLSLPMNSAKGFDTQVVKTAKKPIILVPGVTGSKLSKHYKSWLWGWTEDLLWVDLDQAIFSSSDSYLDPLRLKPNGREPLNLPSDEYIMCAKNPRTGGYATNDIDNGFKDQTITDLLFTLAMDVWISMEDYLEDNGYELGVNLFYAPYDWRMRINEQCNVELRDIIGFAKQRSGWDKVDVIAHSMGGMVVKSYIESSDSNAANIDRFISVGTPYLGSPLAISRPFNGEGYDFHNPTKMKELMRNIPSVYQLMPSRAYYEHVINSSYYNFGGVQWDSYCSEAGGLDLDRDGVSNESLDFSEVTNVIKYNLNSSFYYTINDELHTVIDKKTAKKQGIRHYVIATNNIPTPYVFQFTNQDGYINPQELKLGVGDGTVPYLSALDAGNYDIDGYYTVRDAEHGEMCTNEDVIMTVGSILGLTGWFSSLQAETPIGLTSYQEAKSTGGEVNGLVMIMDTDTLPEIVDKNNPDYRISKKYDEKKKTYLIENKIGKGSYVQKLSNLYIVYLPDAKRSYDIKANGGSIKELQVRKYTNNSEQVVHHFKEKDTSKKMDKFQYDAENATVR